ncbi:MAG: hypothetical protein A2152_01790 [Candidatus Levybacteria bacterium RBG_16_35_6]|nr:MAG: hypothetical protein A2152_01790 [Candidatus Levybacteria bacterium RBG_16_35_6]
MSVTVESPKVDVEKITWLSLKTEGTTSTWRARVLAKGIAQLKGMQSQEERDLEAEKQAAQRINSLLNCDGRNPNFPQTYLSEVSGSFSDPIISHRASIVRSEVGLKAECKLPDVELLTMWGRFLCLGFGQGEKDTPWVPSETGDWFLKFDDPEVDLGITYHDFHFAPVRGISSVEIATINVPKKT